MNSNKYIISTVLAGVLIGCGGGSSSNTSKDEGKPDGGTQQSGVVIKPKAQQNADNSNVGFDIVKSTPTKSLDYNSKIEQYAEENNSPGSADNYVRSIATHGDKMAVASVYHSALTVFDTANDKLGFTPFASSPKASDDHDINGKELTKEGKVDGVTQASENWLNEVKFSKDGEYVYLNVRPKYLGRTKDRALVPDPATYGLYKAKLLANNKVVETDATRFKGQFFTFDFLNDGGVIARESIGKDGVEDKIVKLDKDLKETSASFIIKNMKRYDVKDDKLYALIDDGTNKYVQQYDIKNGTTIGDKIPYNKEIDSKGYSTFELTPNAKKVITYVPSKVNGEVCSLTFATKALECSNIEVPLYSAVGAISPNGKYAAFTPGKYAKKGSIIDITNKPVIVGQFGPVGKTSYAVHFISNSKIVYSSDRREIKIHDIAKTSEKITQDYKMKMAKDSLFSANAKDMNNIEVEQEEDDGKIEIEGDINFVPFLYGVNISYELSKEFKDYINEKGEFIKVPNKPISGTIKATLTMLKNGEVVKTSTKTSPMTIKPKK